MERPSLRASRERAGLTQQALARASGVSLRTIRALENGATERPRRQSLVRLATALGLGGAQRQEWLAGWGGPATPDTVPPDDLLTQPRDFAGLLDLARDRMSLFHVVESRSTSTLGPARIIETDEIERVALPRGGGLSAIPLILDTGSVARPDLATVEPLEGCEVRRVQDFPDVDSKLVMLGPRRRLAEGEPWLYRVRVSYDVETSRAPYGPGSEPWRAETVREVLIGLTQQALLCIVRARFRREAPPLTCRQVFHPRLGEPVRDLGEAPVDPDGIAQYAVPQPGPGWYGLTWTW